MICNCANSALGLTTCQTENQAVLTNVHNLQVAKDSQSGRNAPASSPLTQEHHHQAKILFLL